MTSFCSSTSQLPDLGFLFLLLSVIASLKSSILFTIQASELPGVFLGPVSCGRLWPPPQQSLSRTARSVIKPRYTVIFTLLLVETVPTLVDFGTVDKDGAHGEHIPEKHGHGGRKGGDGVVEFLHRFGNVLDGEGRFAKK